jgi:hypothetical protein
MNNKTFVANKQVNSGRVVISTISTAGRFMPAPSPFETIVFEAHPNEDEVLKYSELDSNGYKDEAAAIKGHEEMVNLWTKI